MSILIEKGGVLTTIQDLGRTGFRRFGINPNGAMDAAACRLINILLGNLESEAVLEMHFPAPKIKFEAAALIAVGGADFGAKLDDEFIENWRPVFAEKDRTLSFTKKISGNRAYLSIRGGLQIENWLGSASTNLAARVGGFQGRSLRAGDRLFFKSKSEIRAAKFAYRISSSLSARRASPVVRVVAGADYERLNALGEQDFARGKFTISPDSDRMGFRLQGAPLHLIDEKELVSSAAAAGTVQLLPDGQLIILMADAQTSGGYPRLAHVVSADLPVLAQMGASDTLSFQTVSVREAEDAWLEFEKNLNLLKIGVNSKYVFER